MLLERKGEHAIEVHVVETRRSDMTQYDSLNLALAGRSPAIERGLHLMGVPGHDEVCRERKRTGLGAQLFHPSPASEPTAGPPNLTLQRMSPLVVVEKPQRGSAKIRDAQCVALMQGSQQES